MSVPGPPVRLRTGHLVRLISSVGTLVLLGGVGAVAMLLSGVPVVAAIGATLLTALTLGSMALWALFLRPRRGRLEVLPGSGELRLPAVAGVRPIVVAWPWLGLVLAALLVLAGVVGIDMGPRIAGPGAGLVLAVIIIGALSRRDTGSHALPYVALSPRGLVHQKSKRRILVPWDEIDTVRIETKPGVLLRVRWAPELGQDEFVSFPLGLHASDPRLVLALVEHYRRHPEHREELADRSAVSRIERGAFLDER
ncbi:hypothetical protein [Actinotalea sp. C106]|uniref:hypothetical protein n=1 Tax=Actinotalea sp. C106 TaxID=2908644 RepID=UPI00202823C3|nr:hypothetical protein [Actinotalea sp. C106]